jgi:hypothetical protein
VRLDPSVDPTRPPVGSSGEVFINQWFSYRKGLQGIKNTRSNAVRVFGQKEKYIGWPSANTFPFLTPRQSLDRQGTVQLEKSLLKYLFYDLLRIANI